jgi:hypothetical protein
MPGLGGKLAVLNCLLWFVFYLATPPLIDQSLVPIAFILGFPLALVVLVADALDLNFGGFFAQMFLTGINSFLWGYGLVWLWSRTINKHLHRSAVRRTLPILRLRPPRHAGAVPGVRPRQQRGV